MQVLLDRDINRLVFDPPGLGCVLYLPGLPNAGAKIHDRSPYGNHGTITGATWERLPSGLWHLHFDGSDDRVNCGSASIFDITDAITLECWVNLDDQTGIDPLICKDYGDDLYPYMLWCSAGNPAIRSYDSGLLFAATSPDKLVAGSWYHIVGTFNKTLPSANAKIFVNAIQKATANYTSSLPTNTQPVDVGYYSGYYAGCDIALPRIYNQALSALEIQNSFNREKHLFGVWQL